MRTRLPTAAATLLLALALAGCLMPKGTPVYVSKQAGDWWSGKGVLMEVSEDETRCHVAARDRALVIDKKWVDCRYVHERRLR